MKLRSHVSGRLLLSALSFCLPLVSATAQKPTVFDLTEVVVGSRRLPTRYFFAVGKWSDAGENVSALSTQIECYKAFGFCEVASAEWTEGEANVNLNSFDILRWDSHEVIAVDSSSICEVDTLRADFQSKRVTLSSSGKGGADRDSLCKGADSIQTAVLLSEDEITKQKIEKAGSRK